MRPAHEKHCFAFVCRKEKIKEGEEQGQLGRIRSGEREMQLVGPTEAQEKGRRDKRNAQRQPAWWRKSIVLRQASKVGGEALPFFLSYTAWWPLRLRRDARSSTCLTTTIGEVSCSLHGGQSAHGLTLQQRIQIYLKLTRLGRVEAQTRPWRG